MFDFAHPASAPSPFSYTSADDTYAVYGWQVSMQRTVREFSALEHADLHGFSLAGSGSATVSTPPLYEPGTRYRVSLVGDRVPPRTEAIPAGPDRRLTIAVPLGPSNPYQQDTLLAQLTGTSVYTTNVTIDPVGTRSPRP
jgi:hypothetical protein